MFKLHSPCGGGWFTTRYYYALWTVLLKLSGRDGKSPLLSKTSYLLLISTALIWVIMLWGSFVLILSSTPDSIVNSSTKLPADLYEKIYYSGFTISTLGVGDFTATSDLWRFFTILFSFSGLILLTMSVTYLLLAVSAALDQRKLGVNISSYGSNPQDIIINSWNGKNFGKLFAQAPTMSDTLIMHSQHHRAYPVIQYFHNPDMSNTIILQMTRLYEAIYIMKNFLKKDMKPSDFEVSTLSVAFDNYLKVIRTITKTDIIDDVEPGIELDRLIEKGFVSPETEVSNLKDKFKSDRKVFFTLLYRNGWRWKDVYQTNSANSDSFNS
ncbi:potassium channel family protein [Antarcticibacterium sp. 1MA-6-2]|uniref:potassium channel family protein n=1 Tax=Antarcticibacterium sp. 1MA-6-2 TaxID=2908210 RepID=UPI001F164D48|nr:potassium channel family protein [Antarcticibacterium sp. 1MA-6-2]UJH92309.1 potassium channel family protein [Antarcticibacterium sp. 1MA-6-2]